MLSDREHLTGIIDRLAVGLVNQEDIATLRGLIERLDELDDLVDAVCSCRTQEIPILRGGVITQEVIQQLRAERFPYDDNAPGRP